jgi:hypothetical protein
MDTFDIFELCNQLLTNENPDIYDSLFAVFTKSLDQLKDINTKYAGKTLLTLASAKRNTNMIKLLLEKGADINISTNDNYYTPLICAMYYRSFVENAKADHVYELLKHKPKLDCQDYVGDTALMVACWGSHPEDDDIGLTLIDMGADINIEKQFSPQQGSVCTNELRGTAFTALCTRNSKKIPKLQKRLLSMGAHINRIKANGASHELFTVCKNKDVYLAEELLKAGANIHHKCYSRHTSTYKLESITTAELIITQKSLHCLVDYLDALPNLDNLIYLAVEHKCYKFIELYINRCVKLNKLGYIYSDAFINDLIYYKCDIIIKRLKRDIFSSLFLILNKKSINKYIGQRIVDFAIGST